MVKTKVTILSDGRALSYHDWGETGMPALIYCHGALSCSRDIAFAAPLAARRGLRLIAIDRPGINASTPRPGRTVAVTAADISELIDRLNLEQCLLLGWSIGSAYALSAAASGDSRIKAVATVGAVAQQPRMINRIKQLTQRSSLPLGIIIYSLSMLPSRWQEGQTKLSAGVDRHLLDSLAPGEVASWYRGATRQGASGIIEDALAFDNDWLESLPNIKVPTIMFHGRQDQIVSPQQSARLARKISTSELDLIDGRGHFLHFQWGGLILDQLIRESGL